MASGSLLGAFWERLGTLWESSGPSGSLLKASKRNLGAFGCLRASGSLLGASGLGDSGSFWVPSGSVLAAPRPAIKNPFWDPWETAVLGQILASSLLEANFWHLAAPRPAIEFLFWDPWETAVLGQILARSLLEAKFWHLAAPRPAIKLPFWDPWETAVLGQILARSLLEAIFCHLKALGPAIKSAFWDHWETALLGQILAKSLLEPDFGILAACRPTIKGAFWDPLGNGRFGPNPGQEPFGSQILGLWWLAGRQLKAPSGIIGKRLFWANSWPGAFWKQNFCPLRAFAEAQRPAAGAREWKGARREQPHERRRNKRKG